MDLAVRQMTRPTGAPEAGAAWWSPTGRPPRSPISTRVVGLHHRSARAVHYLALGVNPVSAYNETGLPDGEDAFGE